MTCSVCCLQTHLVTAIIIISVVRLGEHLVTSVDFNAENLRVCHHMSDHHHVLHLLHNNVTCRAAGTPESGDNTSLLARASL